MSRFSEKTPKPTPPPESEPTPPPKPRQEPPPASSEVLIWNPFTGPNGVIAKEGQTVGLSHMNPGALNRDDNAGWSGPDKPNGSAVFRMESLLKSLPPDIDISRDLKIDALTTTFNTPKVAWDGAHVWVRFQSQYRLHAVTVGQRDGVMVINKKVAGGHSNDGTYYTLGSEKKGCPIPAGGVAAHRPDCPRPSDGSVVITAKRDGYTLSVVDNGVGGIGPLPTGVVGMRVNANTRFRNILVTKAAT